MINTKARHREICAVAIKVLADAGGVEVIDALPQDERPLKLRQMAKAVAKLADCTINTARLDCAKTRQQARFGSIMKDNWGGSRESDKLGPAPLPEDQKRVAVSTRLAPGSKELALAIAKVLELPGWGHVVDRALIRMVEGDRELKVKLAEMGIIVKKELELDV